MVTADELRDVPLFAGLEEPDLEWLCRVVADITLSPAEFVVHDGDPSALLALLDDHALAANVPEVAT